MTTRTEKDLIGEMQIPEDALYGIHTARAKDNFRISGVPLGSFPDLVIALAMVKKAAALANAELDQVSGGVADVIVWACDQIISGRYHDAFVVDMIQGGAGTSTNMNANEVIANLALQKLGCTVGDYGQVHPNDHVNRSQSTNDVYPTAIRVALISACDRLLIALQRLAEAFAVLAGRYAQVPKLGRTQLQDAVPMRVEMEFGAFATSINRDIHGLTVAMDLLREVNLGGTAIGTGITAPEGFAQRAVGLLRAISGFDLQLADDLIAAGSDVSAFVSMSAALKGVALRLSKVCNDLRLLSSGPRGGIGEILLPALQAGSSIMPGKVNPVVPEMVNQVAFQVIGNDLTITMAAEAGELQLNAMEPIIAYNLFTSLHILTRAVDVLRVKCVDGIVVDAERCRSLLDNSLAAAASLVPHIGYEQAAKAAKMARDHGLTLQEAVQQLGLAVDLKMVASPVG